MAEDKGKLAKRLVVAETGIYIPKELREGTNCPGWVWIPGWSSDDHIWLVSTQYGIDPDLLKRHVIGTD